METACGSFHSLAVDAVVFSSDCVTVDAAKHSTARTKAKDHDKKRIKALKRVWKRVTRGIKKRVTRGIRLVKRGFDSIGRAPELVSRHVEQVRVVDYVWVATVHCDGIQGWKRRLSTPCTRS